MRLLSLYAHTYAPLPKSHEYKVNNKTFFLIFCLRHVHFLSVFLSMRITEKHGTHGYYDVSRYPPSQPRPHCAFPWLLDKLRWTKAIVTAVSNFLVQNRARILRTGQHNSTKNFQEYPPRDLKPGSKFTCQFQCCQLSRIIRQTPDFEPYLLVSRLEPETSRIILKVCHFL